MTVAAIYARYSSDNQHEETIEIQVEHCENLIAGNGWTVGEVYADYAKTGTNDRRPSFQRCIADAKAGLFDVLVIYKIDRFARNVEVSRRYKRELRDCGVRLVSVREGEQENKAASILSQGVHELVAEYHSNNVSELVKDAIRQRAEEHRAAGRRMFGYAVDETDHFVPDPEQAPIVRELFERYVAGQSSNMLADWLASVGVRTKKGNAYTRKTVLKLLQNEAYVGVYEYSGVRDEDGMPALVDKGLFLEVQTMMKTGRESRRKSFANDFLLTDRMFCLACGGSMCGTSGTSKTGKKYSYYGCINKGGCGLRVPADAVEDAVISELSAMLAEGSVVEEMADAVLAYEKDRFDLADAYRRELADCKSRRANLVKSLEEGIPAASVMDALNGLEERISELEALLAVEEYKSAKLKDRDTVVGYVREVIERAEQDPAKADLLVYSFVKAVYADKDDVIVVFDICESDEEPGFEEVKALKETNPAELASSNGVRKIGTWGTPVPSSRTRMLCEMRRSFLLWVSLH